MRLNRLLGLTSFGILTFYLVGCAAASRSLRSQPTGHFTVEDFSPKGKLDGLVTLHCTRIARTENKPKGEPNGECEYTSADVTKLIERLPENEPNSDLRDATLDLLLGLSDHNCSNFLSRAFAVRSTFDVTSTFIGDISTAVSAGTVVAAPGLSAGLDALNLIVGKANTNFDKEFYQGEQFHALEAAIAAERTKRKTAILARRSTDKYSLMNALSDARFYDDACSIKVGIENLSDIAKKAAKQEKDKNLKVQNVNPKNRAQELIKLDEKEQQ